MVMRVVFLGTPSFAVPSLRRLLEDPGIEVATVVTQPDRKAGRGQRLTPPPVKVAAIEAGLRIAQFERIRNNPEAHELMLALRPDVAVVVAFGQILPLGFFDLPPFGTVNLHASMLPAYRGAAPAVHAILNGERETGVTIMRIDEGMDTGDVLLRKAIRIGEEMTAGALEDLLAREGAELLPPTLHDYLSGRIRPELQQHGLATLAPRIRKEDGRIDWGVEAWAVHNRIRAMNPWPGAFSSWRGEEVKIWRSLASPTPGGPEGNPGVIVDCGRDYLEVGCGSGAVRLLELQLPARKRVDARDFINGARPRLGERFG
jgi:methionyl-tRNA formyltransferase